MEYILTDDQRMEIGYLDENVSLDVDVGIENDFEIVTSKQYANQIGMRKGCFLIVPGTEFGGPIKNVSTNTNATEVTYSGITWRGLLKKVVIEPPTGSTHLTVSGDANRVLEELLNHGTGLYFRVPAVDSGIMIESYKFRYVEGLLGIESMLASVGARLDIVTEEGAANEGFQVLARVVKSSDYSEELDYSGDDDVNVSIYEYESGTNHLICLGSGDGLDRDIVHLYVQLDGSILEDKQYYTGTDETTEVYDYSSAENHETLVAEGMQRLRELMNYKTGKMQVGNIDLSIGDTVSARDRELGLIMKKQVIGKILRLSEQEESIEYKVEGEE